nr:hypothetical protein [Actinomycetota bacterium]NIU68446.1 hypothetical protein [Actinomycetota bacterium]NIW30273.1 hypothetical protein [Actinomycetota bacterium]NIX22694.1 hypothetical protein [Actinomycetota bacterium]
MAVKRRKLRGKQLLIVAGSLAGASFMGCTEDSRPTDAATDGSADSTVDTSVSDTAVANLIPPPDSALMDAPVDSTVDDGSMDATTDG